MTTLGYPSAMTDEKARPLLIVRGVYVRDHRVALVQEHDGAWALPGGYVKLGEDPLAALWREITEETGTPPLSISSICPRVVYGSTGDSASLSALRLIYPVFLDPKSIPVRPVANEPVISVDWGHEEEVAATGLWHINRLPRLCTRRGTRHDLRIFFGSGTAAFSNGQGA